MNVQEMQALANSLRSQASLREARWRQLSRWIFPARGIFEFNGQDREEDGLLLFNHAPSQATLRGASGMTSGMTPRNTAWFKSDFGHPQFLEITGARQWLDEVNRLMRECLSSGGFYQAIQSFNLDLLWAGCALLFAGKNDETALHFECVQIGTFAVQTDQRGQLDVVLRKLQFTVEDMVREFGEDKINAASREKLRHSPWDKETVWHMARRDGQGAKPVSSRYWQEGGTEFLRENGFHEMPFFFTCWHEGKTPYGTGPGDDALGDARQLDTLEKRKLEGIAKLTQPPVIIPTEMKSVIDLSPRAINFVPQNVKVTPALDLSPIASAMPALQNEIAIVTQRLEQALYASIFTSMPLDQRPRDMSATEFLERKREALQQLGPVMSAYEPNVLTPLLYRVLHTLDRENVLPPLPEQLAQMGNILMRMDFISPMANALRQTGAETTRAIFQDVAMMAQAAQNPELLDKLDCDQMIDELATGLGCPGSIIRSDEDVMQIRQQRQQQQMQQQAMQEQMQQAQVQQAEAGAMNQQAQAAQTMQAMEQQGEI